MVVEVIDQEEIVFHKDDQKKVLLLAVESKERSGFECLGNVRRSVSFRGQWTYQLLL